jgi:diketogulonate reductase-like aldo/keto reductase
MGLDIHSTLKLSNGVEIPRLGLGTFRAEKGPPAQNAVVWALESGYRHIDTAAMYANEDDVGLAVKRSRTRRADIFITTKVRNDDQGYALTLQACEASLKNLATDYIDLYLIHWPVTGLRAETWQALVKLYEQGKCRAIGVCNYTIRHLEELLPNTGLAPMVNQIEIHPFLYRKDLIDYCQARGIVVEAYSPLSKARRMQDPRLLAVAAHYGKTVAQVMLRWTLQHDLVTIPKSVNPERILENTRLYDFTLSAEDMAEVDGMNENYYTVRQEWIPDKWA